MSESEWDKTYETNYQSPLWRMVKERAEKKDISYFAAYREVLPEYQLRPQALSMLYVESTSGKLVPLSAVARLESGFGPLTVNHSVQFGMSVRSPIVFGPQP